MSDQVPPPGWFLRPENWPYWMPNRLIGTLPPPYGSSGLSNPFGTDANGGPPPSQASRAWDAAAPSWLQSAITPSAGSGILGQLPPPPAGPSPKSAATSAGALPYWRQTVAMDAYRAPPTSDQLQGSADPTLPFWLQTTAPFAFEPRGTPQAVDPPWPEPRPLSGGPLTVDPSLPFLDPLTRQAAVPHTAVSEPLQRLSSKEPMAALDAPLLPTEAGARTTRQALHRIFTYLTDEPYRAAMGQMTEEEAKQFFVDQLLGFLGPGKVAAPVANKLAILGGGLAKWFPRSRVALAEEMEAAGRSANEIWQRTGLGRSADNRWIFEIPDTGYRVNPKAGKLTTSVPFPEPGYDREFHVAPLFDHFNHPGLRANYPHLARAKSYLTIDENKLNEGFAAPGLVQIRAPSLERAQTMGIHEMQHLVGIIEAGPDSFAPKFFERIGYPQWKARQMYLQQAPEVESRNAEKRLFKNEQSRRLESPVSTEDVPRGSQIIHYRIGHLGSGLD
jgi:hypothetical protein